MIACTAGMSSTDSIRTARVNAKIFRIIFHPLSMMCLWWFSVVVRRESPCGLYAIMVLVGQRAQAAPGGYRREGMRSVPSRIRLGSIHYASAFPHVACALAEIHRFGYGMSVPRTAVCRQCGGSVRSYAISHSPRFHSQKERSGHTEEILYSLLVFSIPYGM